MNIAFCSSEVVPFAKTGGMADVCGALPLALEKLGVNCHIFLPFFKTVNLHGHKLRKISEDLSATTIGNGIQVYLIKNDFFYGREGLYGDKYGDYPDNLERFQFFCERTLQIIKQLDLQIDIVHCHDWQSGLIPAYLKNLFQNDPALKKIKSILTIHNLAYQGVFSKFHFEKLKLPSEVFNPNGFEFYDQINLLKGGIVYSDVVSTVSQTYAREILTEQYGCGLQGVLQTKKTIAGILNGLDYELWDPKTDPYIFKNYSPDKLEGKALNKNFLQAHVGLEQNPDVPLFGFVGRLSHQKGLDLINEAMSEIVKLNLQVVFLGIGEQKYHELLEGLAKKFPGKVAVCLKFDERMARQVYAGSDIFLMPSLYEPCGLSQMISLYYGSVPLVYKTGGLADTIIPHHMHGGNGFIFSRYVKEDLVALMKEAVQVYNNKPVFANIMQRGFKSQFSWTHSAEEYKKLYEKVLS